MAPIALNQPHGSEFDSFLYADVGEDRRGYVVTVLSALARLGLEPWQEASELDALSRDAARLRLAALLSKFKDVPALGVEHLAVAARLTLLLPERPSHRVSKLARSTIPVVPPISVRWALAALIVVIVLVRVYFLADSG